MTDFHCVDVNQRVIVTKMRNSGETCVGHDLGEEWLAVVSDNT